MDTSSLSILEAFDETWRRALLQELPAPSFAEWCDKARSSSPSSQECVSVLRAMAVLDLRRRWKRAADLPTAMPVPDTDDKLAAETSHGLSEFPSRPRLDDYLQAVPELGPLKEWPIEHLVAEFQVQREFGMQPDVESWLGRFPAQRDVLRLELSRLKLSKPLKETDLDPAALSPVVVPPVISGFRIEGRLGSGGFGAVWKAFDLTANRYVAIKVPHSGRGTADMWQEASQVGVLDIPGVVPLYHVGRLGEPGGATGSTNPAVDTRAYLVYRFIDGQNLAARLRKEPIDTREAVRLTLALAEILVSVHRQRKYHLDIKPANVLIDVQGQVWLTDFGLASRTSDLATHALGGTPEYASPEQIRGEWSRIDGRSDIYSLGSVFYELLTGTRPYRSRTRAELLRELSDSEPIPPRELKPEIPRRLEEICLTCLASRTSDRYSTASDLVDELRSWLDGPAHALQELPLASASPPLPTAPQGPTTAATAQAVAFKRLRPFDESDAEAFASLLPRKNMRGGLPESIWYWTTRIVRADGEPSFPVGLLTGPSGCGKSSLVRAGILPRLPATVTSLYVEATAGQTEADLVKQLARRGFKGASLVETLAELAYPAAKKSGRVLIVLDQFEQWLHSHQQPAQTELVNALRHCDGQRLQCLLLVRDRFDNALTRFFDALDFRLDTDANWSTVEPFDAFHARRVLTEFGRALERFPGDGPLDPQQEQFVRQAVDQLSAQHAVEPVRLALFVEMLQQRPWTEATLKEIGNLHELGVQYLDEVFFGRSARPDLKAHQQTAQKLLRELLPDDAQLQASSDAGDSDIKRRRGAGELAAACGQDRGSAQFQQLLRTLSRDLPLVAPVETAGETATAPASDNVVVSGETQYALAHDFLVPVIREWLTRDQKKTRRGRAVLMLEDRTSAWITSGEDPRHLPDLWQFVQIGWYAPRATRTATQRRMMSRAFRHHAARQGLVVSLLLVLLLALAIGGPIMAWRELRLRRERELALEESRGSFEAFQQFAYEVQSELSRQPGNARLKKRLIETTTASLEQLKKSSGHNARAERAIAFATVYLGDVLLQNDGRTAQALEAYETAHRSFQQLAQADPADPQAQRDLATVFLKLGDVKLRLGKHAEAAALYQDSLKIRHDLSKAAPDDVGLQVELSWSHSKLGHALDRDDRRAALVHFERCHALRLAVAAARPDDVVAKQDLAHAVEELANVTGGMKALRLYEEALSIVQPLAQADPDDMLMQRDMSVYHGKIGSVLYEQKQFAQALVHHEKCLKLRLKQYNAPMQDAEVLRSVMSACWRLGDTQLQLGQLPEAKANYERSKTLVGELAGFAREDFETRRDQSIVEQKLAEYEQRCGRPREALELYQKSRSICDAMLNAAPKDARAKADLAGIDVLIGRTYEELYDYASARQHYALALAPLNQLKQQEILSPRMDDILNELPLRDAFCRYASRAVKSLEAALEPADAGLVNDGLIARAGYSSMKRNHAQAEGALEKLRERTTTAPQSRYLLAAGYSRAAWAMTLDKPQLTEDESRIKSQYIADGLAALQQAVDAGFKDAAQLRTDRQMLGLRSDPAFQQLLLKLER